MTTGIYTHMRVLSIHVLHAFYDTVGRERGYARASRTVSGLLKAAAKRGDIKRIATYGRVTGDSVSYVMTEEQVEAIQAAAIEKAKKA